MAIGTTTALLLGAVASAGASIYQGQQQAKQSKKASQEASARDAAAIQAAKDAQSTSSSQAVEAVKRRRSSATQTVYSSPLGISGQASTISKTLTGQ